MRLTVLLYYMESDSHHLLLLRSEVTFVPIVGEGFVDNKESPDKLTFLANLQKNSFLRFF